MTELTKPKQSHGFQPGQSGNPAGRPKGARNKATLLIQELLDGEAERLGRKLIEMALEGDGTAMRLAVERIVPPRKDRPVEVSLPTMQTAADAVAATGALFAQVAAGDLTPGEASELAKLVDTFARTVEVQDLERRLAKLEEGLKR